MESPAVSSFPHETPLSSGANRTIALYMVVASDFLEKVVRYFFTGFREGKSSQDRGNSGDFRDGE
jgi:hypothetical protein